MWGPKFSDDLSSIPLAVIWHVADERQRLFSGISRTEFCWGRLSDGKVFEAEELRDFPTEGNNTSEKYSCRYVHSMVDKDLGNVVHADGAIRSYPMEKYIERLDTDLAKANRNTEYSKLWRVDGELSIKTWKKLISDYFRDNMLVGEYLGANSDFSEKLKHFIPANSRESVKCKFVPFAFQSEGG